MMGSLQSLTMGCVVEVGCKTEGYFLDIRSGLYWSDFLNVSSCRLELRVLSLLSGFPEKILTDDGSWNYRNCSYRISSSKKSKQWELEGGRNWK